MHPTEFERRAKQFASEKPKSEATLAAPSGSAKTWTDEQLNWLLQEIELNAKLKEADNKKLLWLAMNTAPWKSLDVMGVEPEIFGEIENRLYPEYDGETVTFEEWGWRTPTGDIRYLPNDVLGDQVAKTDGANALD